MPDEQISAISKATAQHYTWRSRCDGWHLLKTSGLSVIQECMPPGTTEVRHLHQRAQQFFYVLAGEAVMEVDSRSIKLSAGEGIWIPVGAAHQIKNDSGCEVHFLVISQPPSHGDRVPAPETPSPDLV
jgi:mannose-6-phosphate isomerase-like protein (cupin superfamily)